jgi:ABC-type microcin C transport system duplicated ATPase subunit YejF
MLFITHNLPLVRSIAQRVAMLSQVLADTPSLETASSEAGAGEPQADN